MDFINDLMPVDSALVKRLQRSMVFDTNKSAARIRNDERHAVSALVTVLKRLRKNKGAVEVLDRAVTSEDCSTKCIVYKMPKKSDANNPTLHKTYPHFTLCKMFRFPEIVTYHQLTHSDHCLFDFATNYQSLEYCINPYHYQLAKRPQIPDMVVPKNVPVDLQTQHRLLTLSGNIDRLCPQGVPNITLDARSIPACSDPDARCFSTDKGENNEDAASSCSSRVPGVASPTSTHVPSPSTDFNDEMETDQDLPSPGSTGSQEPSNRNIYAKPPMSNDSDWHRTAESPFGAIMGPDGDIGNVMSTDTVARISFQESPVWCTVGYYEEETCVRSDYHGSRPSFVIDGYTSVPDEERFSVGNFTNSKRSKGTLQVRQFIGKGIRLYYIAGDVFVENLSAFSIFVQSPMAAHRYNWHTAAVCKIAPNSHFKIFSMTEFATLLGIAVKDGFETTFALTRMCTVRISLVKGWGKVYKRHSVNKTPVWFQVHLTSPLQWLDRILIEMGGPPERCTSFS
ncbi:unnamed protein product [Bursaphelenchus okinawaensis]|uniref:Mothers against decapentaplegic homolog n=1 Tax=Bursaphelenchus okinawaensis TaxID=465554 RepID=A0A811JUS2_9BILA|nr:unnamed protein product [Bursaphelenchus okinawaensis]CAG9084187.1 unnamed protein product [Bursaphelenchus okinawaensis]